MNPLKNYKQKSLNKQLLDAANKEVPLLQDLLKKGADIHAVTPDGKNLLDLVWRDKNIQFYLDQGLSFSGQSRLNYALYHCVKNPKTLAQLIALGGDVNSSYNDSFYPIHSALTSDTEASLLILLKNNVDVNNKNYHGNTPLHIAIHLKNINAVHLLLKHHARPDIIDKDGNTPIDLARRLYQKTQEPSYQEMLNLLIVDMTPAKEGTIMDKEKISFIREEPELGLRFTQIFNFASGTYHEVVYCPETKCMSNTVVSLNTLKDTKLFAAAEAEFIKQGGVPDYSFKKRLDKN